ncbi:hypothetical protein HPA02_16670 [Bisbaumannia pacifica]|uniref:Uncharacterized protein n=1 Tax=Bisbaumannia pacifica TaxID=77098 RepID=A0A510X7M2_9GAMM|nr:hypothetical protein HPA02_16670 [Halomonas pacifica]
MLVSPLGDRGNPAAKEVAPRDTALAVACPQIGKTISEQGRGLRLADLGPERLFRKMQQARSPVLCSMRVD